MGSQTPKNGRYSDQGCHCGSVWFRKRPIMGAAKSKNGQCSKVVLKWSCERPIMGAVKPKSGLEMGLQTPSYGRCRYNRLGVTDATDTDGSIFQFRRNYATIDAIEKMIPPAREAYHLKYHHTGGSYE